MVIKKKRLSSKPSKLASSARKTDKKQNNVLQKAKLAQKILQAKMVTLKAEFKAKLQKLSRDAYEQALMKVTTAERKRALAKSKALAAAEATFEKKYARKPASRAKSIKPRKTKRKVEAGL